MPIYNWGGFYVGGEVGGVTRSETDPSGFAASTAPSGALGGLQAGYNDQIAPTWLIGVEDELSWASAKGSSLGFRSDQRWDDTLGAKCTFLDLGSDNLGSPFGVAGDT
jgi:hypothetical protein